MDRESSRRVTIALWPPSPQKKSSSRYRAQNTPLTSRSVSASSTPCPTRVPAGLAQKSNTQSSISKETTLESTASSTVQPNSVLLQSLIKERRAFRESRRSSSSNNCDYATSTPAQLQPQDGTTTPSGNQRALHSSLSTGSKPPHQMGLRETDEYVSKITKLNFDLKLQIWHRDQQVEALTRKLDRMQELKEEVKRMSQLENELEKLRNVAGENRELKQSNDSLREEIQRRDQAIAEAVDLICQLEAKVEELEGEQAPLPSTPPSLLESKPVVDALINLKTQTNVDIPERTSSKKATRARYSRKSFYPLKRAPSFLREDNKSTLTLRSLYRDESFSVLSTLTGTESLHSDETAEPASPRLSALSECSELTPSSLTILNRSETPVQDLSSDSYGVEDDTRVERWVQSRADDFQATLQKWNGQSVLEASQSTHSPDTVKGLHVANGFKGRLQRSEHDIIYDGSRLPPTPDTMSSARQASINRSNSSRRPEDIPSSGREFDQIRSASAMATIRPGLTGATSGESACIRDRIRIEDNPRKKSSIATQLPLDKRSTESLASDVEERPSTSCTFGTFDHYLGPTISPHSLRQDDFISEDGRLQTPDIERRPFTSPCSPAEGYPSRPDPSLYFLETEDWLEAAKMGPLSNNARTPARSNRHASLGTPCSSQTDPLQFTGKRVPGRFSFFSRRYKTNTAPFGPKKPVVGNTPGTERPRRRWFLPLFRRPRQFEAPSTKDSSPAQEDEDYGAPAPVIRKARTTHYSC